MKDNQEKSLGPSAPFGLSLLRMANSLCKAQSEMKYDFLTPAELALGIVSALMSLVGSQVEINGNAEEINDSRVSVMDANKNSNGGSFCEKCKSELINFYWRSKGFKSDVLEEKANSMNLCNSCFAKRDLYDSTQYELMRKYLDNGQLNQLAKDIKNLSGWLR